LSSIRDDWIVATAPLSVARRLAQMRVLDGRSAVGPSRAAVAATRTMVMTQSDALREAQERISKRIVSMLGLTAADYS
jgi:hypothetical protein